MPSAIGGGRAAPVHPPHLHLASERPIIVGRIGPVGLVLEAQLVLDVTRQAASHPLDDVIRDVVARHSIRIWKVIGFMPHLRNRGRRAPSRRPACPTAAACGREPADERPPSLIALVPVER